MLYFPHAQFSQTSTPSSSERCIQEILWHKDIPSFPQLQRKFLMARIPTEWLARWSISGILTPNAIDINQSTAVENLEWKNSSPLNFQASRSKNFTFSSRKKSSDQTREVGKRGVFLFRAPSDFFQVMKISAVKIGKSDNGIQTRHQHLISYTRSNKTTIIVNLSVSAEAMNITSAYLAALNASSLSPHKENAKSSISLSPTHRSGYPSCPR